jgi:Mg-chelatase subunit ChlD
MTMTIRPMRLALSVAVLSLAACAAALGAGDAHPDDESSSRAAPARPAWPPYGGAAPQRPQEPGSFDAESWGVPPFDPPAADHCRLSPRVREVPGPVQPTPLPWPRGWRSGSPPPVAERSHGDTSGAATKSSRAEAAAASPPVAAAHEAHDAAVSAGAPAAAPQAQRLPRPQVRVTAGMVDDNADFGEYLAYRQRATPGVVRDRDVAERYRVEVRDAAGRAVPDAELALTWPGAATSVVWARTDAGGTAWLHPRAIVPPDVAAHTRALEVQVRHGRQLGRVAMLRGQKQAVQLRLGAAAFVSARARLDLVFLVDATGSMGDEIHKLKTSLRDIADQIAVLPSRPDLCFALVAYRDQGDAFVLRTHDFTHRLDAFQGALDRLHAGGGGDYPESLNEALHETVHRLSWRGDGAQRLVLLVADAPPHLGRDGAPYDATMAAALAKGIKLFAVGASGLDAQGEYVFRQLAQYTGGRFVFLTYRDARQPGRGPGTETTHDVSNYSVNTLDQLVVRLVREELARRPAM